MEKKDYITPEEYRLIAEYKEKHKDEWDNPYADYVGDMEDALENS